MKLIDQITEAWRAGKEQRLANVSQDPHNKDKPPCTNR